METRGVVLDADMVLDVDPGIAAGEGPLGMVRLLEAGSKATQKVGDEVRIDVKEDSALLFNDDNERLIEGARVSVAGLAATG